MFNVSLKVSPFKMYIRKQIEYFPGELEQ